MSVERLRQNAETLLDNVREHRGDYLGDIEIFIDDLIDRLETAKDEDTDMFDEGDAVYMDNGYLPTVFGRVKRVIDEEHYDIEAGNEEYGYIHVSHLTPR